MSISRILSLVVIGIYLVIFFLLQEVGPIGDFLWVVQVSHARWFFLPLVFGVILIWFYDKPEDNEQVAMLVGGWFLFLLPFMMFIISTIVGKLFFKGS